MHLLSYSVLLRLDCLPTKYRFSMHTNHSPQLATAWPHSPHAFWLLIQGAGGVLRLSYFMATKHCSEDTMGGSEAITANWAKGKQGKRRAAPSG